jgi:metal-responsive CopG/Arc/MetJ family transcriptional regulator
MRGRYATVKIPFELAAKLDVLVNELGYRSRAEVVNDAIRRFLDARQKMDEMKMQLEQPAPVPLTVNNLKR